MDIKGALETATAEIDRLKQDNDQLKKQQESNKSENIELRNRLETKHISVARLTTDNEAKVSQLERAKALYVTDGKA